MLSYQTRASLKASAKREKIFQKLSPTTHPFTLPWRHHRYLLMTLAAGGNAPAEDSRASRRHKSRATEKVRGIFARRRRCGGFSRLFAPGYEICELSGSVVAERQRGKICARARLRNSRCDCGVCNGLFEVAAVYESFENFVGNYCGLLSVR